MQRHIRFDGGDDSYFYFSTPTWSGMVDHEGNELRYDITVCRSEGWVKCSCRDSVCRFKQGYLLDESPHACKHVRVLLKDYLKRYIGI